MIHQKSSPEDLEGKVSKMCALKRGQDDKNSYILKALKFFY